MEFHSDYCFKDRKTKAQYVWEKYHKILNGRILDVGADECYLKQHLPSHVEYIGIGLGGSPDIQINLEIDKIPFDDKSFNCVLCLDVLEHLDNIHEMFDELCRVTDRYLIISLPNPWSSFFKKLRYGEYTSGQMMKFYGLPLEKPIDRHKWFFSIDEAERFIRYRALKNSMHIVHIDYGISNVKTLKLWNKFQYFITFLCSHFLLLKFRYLQKNLFTNSIWVVLEKESVNNQV